MSIIFFLNYIQFISLMYMHLPLFGAINPATISTKIHWCWNPGFIVYPLVGTSLCLSSLSLSDPYNDLICLSNCFFCQWFKHWSVFSMHSFVTISYLVFFLWHSVYLFLSLSLSLSVLTFILPKGGFNKFIDVFSIVFLPNFSLNMFYF